MLIKFIQKLRKKPESSRALFVWVSTAVIMLTIIALWLDIGVKQNLSPVRGTNQLTVDKSSKKEISKFSQFFQDAKNDFFYLKENLSKSMGDLFSGKDEPKTIPPALQQYLPQKPNHNITPLQLPKTK